MSLLIYKNLLVLWMKYLKNIILKIYGKIGREVKWYILW